MRVAYEHVSGLHDHKNNGNAPFAIERFKEGEQFVRHSHLYRSTIAYGKTNIKELYGLSWTEFTDLTKYEQSILLLAATEIINGRKAIADELENTLGGGKR